MLGLIPFDRGAGRGGGRCATHGPTYASGVPVVVLLIAIALFGGAILLIVRAYSPTPAMGLCPRCGYTLAGLPVEGPCPECGDSAESRRRAIDGRPTPWAVLKVPLGLIVGAQALLLVSIVPGLRDPGVLIAAIVCTPIPHAVLAFVLWANRRRLTPRAAIAIAVGGLLGITPALAWVCVDMAHQKPDAFSGVVIMFASAAATAPLSVGLFAGSLLIQRRWFKQWTSSRPAS